MSKELEALENIILYLNASEPKGLYCKDIETIKAALKKQEQDKKKLEAFEIIKKKEVDVSCLLFDGLEEYNNFMREDRIITQSEFDLLKEVLL